MFYFSYGSNMSSKRLKNRVPSASFVATATLVSHKLEFHKLGTDGSSKCDAHETGNENHEIIGVVYEISEQEKPVLDKKEGLGNGYEEKYVKVEIMSGTYIEAIMYYATRIDASRKPYHWYKHHVIYGAEEYKLPQEYVDKIRRIESVKDPIPSRHEKELSIYADDSFHEMLK